MSSSTHAVARLARGLLGLDEAFLEFRGSLRLRHLRRAFRRKKVQTRDWKFPFALKDLGRLVPTRLCREEVSWLFEKTQRSYTLEQPLSRRRRVALSNASRRWDAVAVPDRRRGSRGLARAPTRGRRRASARACLPIRGSPPIYTSESVSLKTRPPRHTARAFQDSIETSESDTARSLKM